VLSINGFGSFAEAMTRKLAAEIASTERAQPLAER